jgi:hypothetical protein
MNYGLLPGFGRKRQTTRRVVGVLRTPQVAPAGYASALAVAAGAVIVNPGSTSAGVLTEYLRVMGAGRIHWLSAYTADGTSRDIRTILTLKLFQTLANWLRRTRVERLEHRYRLGIR